ncbi:CTP synthase C-terminal region-related (seleno)protein [Plantactinospora sp. ZYX-F-223]|uniref:CTP synthase C-terminal region-related (seleno)protein n=1 Tax=Plantactinospora sp. ZYX-F-223 TaxID=3144103 RepID=UPI0031FDA16D
MSETRSAFTARVAAVGDRSPHVRAHARMPVLLDALRLRDRLDLDLYWIPTPEAADGGTLAGFDGIWLTPGSPYRSEVGAISAVRTAREQGIPFLGTCGGFQHALLEYARDVCGLSGAAHGENNPEATGELLIEPLACSLAGHEGTVRIAAGSLAERVLGAGRSVERYQCSYGVNPSYLDVLRAHGLHLTGFDEAGDVRVAELPGHPFFLCTLFQPELAGDGTVVHPMIRAFATAAALHAGSPDPIPAT